MRCLARHTGQEFTVECIVKTSIFYQGDLLRAHRRVLSQDFHFDHPGTDSVVEPRLRCKGFRTACTFDPPFGGGPVYRLASGKAARETGSGNRGKPGQPQLMGRETGRETGTASVSSPTKSELEGNRDSLSFFAHEIRARGKPGQPQFLRPRNPSSSPVQCLQCRSGAARRQPE